MDLIRNLISLVVLLSLAACDPAGTPPEPPKVETTNVEATKVQPAPAALTNKATKVEPALPAVSKPAVDPAAAPKIRAADQVKPKPAVVASKPKADELKAPLDMSLNPEVFDPMQPLEPLVDQSSSLLPPLFGEKIAPEDGFQLNGKLISNQRDDDYWQSLEGAQLQFEFKQ